MAIFYDLPNENNNDIDVYAILRSQFLVASKKKAQLIERLKHIVDPGEVRFYKKKVKYTPKGSIVPKIYEYNCHYLRYSKVQKDKHGIDKVRFFTRFLTNREYEKTKKECVLYKYLKESLDYVSKLAEITKAFLLSSFYHHPDSIPDFVEEETNVTTELNKAISCRMWHLEHRAVYAPEKYKCLDNTDLLFMSRGELLLHDAFLHCGLTPQYETVLKFDDTEQIDLDNYIFSQPVTKYYYPDFKCCCAGQTYYFEYFGMMNDPAYFNEACKKIEAYTRNGIVPGYNFIAFCSCDPSAFHVKPVMRVLEKIVSGRTFIETNNLHDLPGIVLLDNAGSFRLPEHLVNFIAEKAANFIPKKHKYKSTIIEGCSRIISKKDSK